MSQSAVDAGDLDGSSESDGGASGTSDHFPDHNRQTSQSEDPPVKKGTLLKWTNYIQGWQERYVVLSNGTLSYYKSEFDTSFGCRGSMSLLMAKVQAHEFDPSRFDVSVTDCIYYLRCDSSAECQDWLLSLQQAKEKLHQDHGYSSDAQSANSPLPLGRGNSLLSLNSLVSTTSKTSQSVRLKEKILEMETFRDLLQHQMDNLQKVFDECLEFVPPTNANGGSVDFGGKPDVDDEDDKEDCDDSFDDDDPKAILLQKKPEKPPSFTSKCLRRRTVATATEACSTSDHRCCEVARRLEQQHSDLRAELITFRATMTGVLSSLSLCSDMFQRKDARFHRVIDHERERRRQLEEALQECQGKLRDAEDKWHHQSLKAGPDFQEGPHSIIREDEFLDAFEGELDRMEQEELDRATSAQRKSAGDDLDSTTSKTHEYQELLEEKLDENIKYCYEEVTNAWSVAYEDGDLKVYRRDLEEGGVVVDPLKAYHTVPGITAYELCCAFYDVKYRMDWESTVESLDVIQSYDHHTVVVHQMLKRVWPSSQREIVFLSAMRPLPSRDAEEKGPGFVVCNVSVDHPALPVTGKFVRAHINVALVAHTVVTDVEEGEPIGRDNLQCRITYSANVNPGGWAPPSVVRAMAKREYPKFLRRFCSYATTNVEDKPIVFDEEEQPKEPDSE